jgi:hypothetical protein
MLYGNEFHLLPWFQFFNGKNYQEGMDWYMNYFPERTNSTWLFEKSATYFDGDFVPARAHRLLPNANIGKRCSFICFDPGLKTIWIHVIKPRR